MNGTIFGGGGFLNKKNVFLFSLNRFLKHFSFYEELSEIWSTVLIGLHVQYQLRSTVPIGLHVQYQLCLSDFT